MLHLKLVWKEDVILAEVTASSEATALGQGRCWTSHSLQRPLLSNSSLGLQSKDPTLFQALKFQPKSGNLHPVLSKGNPPPPIKTNLTVKIIHLRNQKLFDTNSKLKRLLFHKTGDKNCPFMYRKRKGPPPFLSNPQETQ